MELVSVTTYVVTDIKYESNINITALLNGAREGEETRPRQAQTARGEPCINRKNCRRDCPPTAVRDLIRHQGISPSGGSTRRLRLRGRS